MAVLLTNGKHYIAHSSTGAVIKVSDRKDAQDFRTAERAVRQKQKAPGKCAGFYCMDTAGALSPTAWAGLQFRAESGHEGTEQDF